MADDPNAARRRSRKRGSAPGPGGQDDEPDATVDDLDPSAEERDVSSGDVDPERPADADPDRPDGADGHAEATMVEPANAEPDGVPSDAAPEPASPESVGSMATEPAPEPAEPPGSTPPVDDWSAEEVAAESATDAPATLWATPVPEPATWLPWLQARSPDDRICPFLRAVADDDSLGFPVEAPDPANRCAAMHEAVPQSLRQQELVCLTATHANCPRYLRGAVVVSEVATARVRPKAVLTPAISASLIILALSFGASVVFGLANGGLTMPSPAASGRPVASASAVAAAPTATTRPTPVTTAPPTSAAPTTSAGPSPSPTPSATPTPTRSSTPPSAPPSPVPSASEVAAATPTPTSGRYKLLKPCPDKPDCWIYTIRSGDNLYSIANYFGVPLKTVKALNPWTKTQSLRAGRKLILPPPTR